MTIGDLLDRLSGYNRDATVTISGYKDLHDTMKGTEISDIEGDDEGPDGPGNSKQVNIRIARLSGDKP